MTAPATPGAAARAVTQNACHLCTPLGACLAFRGIRGAVPFLHGSQGCATYIRRYLISHFREPVDIGASNFSEAAAVFGGGEILERGLENVRRQYAPELVGLATTCLSETIGEDVPLLLRACNARHAGEPDWPRIVHVSTASYRGSYVDGFHDAVCALVAGLAAAGPPASTVTVFPGLVSPADLRHLRELLAAFGLGATLVPDYADTLDAPVGLDYPRIPPGGTAVDELVACGRSRASLQLGRTLAVRGGPGTLLHDRCGVPCVALGLPVGIRETDALVRELERLSGQPLPAALAAERGRLVDAYVDGHKYVAGVRVAVFGEPDLVIGLTALLSEIGMRPAVCASGAPSRWFAEALRRAEPGLPADCTVLDDADFARIEAAVDAARPDLLVGSSKGYPTARRLGIPLVRVGFPVHDRIGAQRLLHLGYRGAQQLFDRVVNTLLEHRQAQSPVGWSYL